MRIIYNTSFIIQEDIENEWIRFIRDHYITPLSQHRVCEDILFTKVSIDQPEGKTYSLQVIFRNEEQQDRFLKEWLPELEEKIIRQYRNRYLCFSSVLTEI